MTHARIQQLTAGILAVALTIAVGLSTSTAPASARTFYFNSAGSMIQQPLPPQVACALRRAMRGQSSACRQSSDR